MVNMNLTVVGNPPYYSLGERKHLGFLGHGQQVKYLGHLPGGYIKIRLDNGEEAFMEANDTEELS